MQSDAFTIEGLSGKKRLKGSIPVYGEKNTVLPVMAAATMVGGVTTLTNVPGITDVDAMAKLIEGLGGYVTHAGRELTVDAKNLSETVLNLSVAKSMRASIVLSGPILARLGQVTFPPPGGDVIGARPIDIFIDGFKMLGATASETAGTYTLSAPHGLSGGEIFFRTVSVTATETFVMAACLAKAPVTLKNCAMEPQVVAVADFLKSCGAKIEGAGTPTIYITPSVLTEPIKPFRIIPDRIEAATFLALGALLGDELTVTGAEPSHMDAVFETFSRMGIAFHVEKDSIRVHAPEKIFYAQIRTHEYPGFPTDAQAPFMVLLTQAEGESSVIESIFDGRLAYTSELVRMGADITLVSPHRAKITGQTPLKAAHIETPDIRAGLAFILAAAVADGTSTVGNAHLIDRGYEHIEKRLAGVGLSIRRI